MASPFYFAKKKNVKNRDSGKKKSYGHKEHQVNRRVGKQFGKFLLI